MRFYNLEVFANGIPELLEFVRINIKINDKKTLTYFNANSFNLIKKKSEINNIFSRFDLIHSDGLGIYLASKFLYGKNGFEKRITGSDFYVELIKKALKENWTFFFFGDTEETLARISKKQPDLRITGSCNGFNYNLNDLIIKINKSNPDILIVGLGSPRQEQWIIENRKDIRAKVIIAVGDGIKVFAGTKKRGPKFLQIIGLEWFIRLFFEPKRLWRRYIVGIPLFILRVLKYKLFKQ